MTRNQIRTLFAISRRMNQPWQIAPFVFPEEKSPRKACQRLRPSLFALFKDGYLAHPSIRGEIRLFDKGEREVWRIQDAIKLNKSQVQLLEYLQQQGGYRHITTIAKAMSGSADRRQVSQTIYALSRRELVDIEYRGKSIKDGEHVRVSDVGKNALVIREVCSDLNKGNGHG